MLVQHRHLHLQSEKITQLHDVTPSPLVKATSGSRLSEPQFAYLENGGSKEQKCLTGLLKDEYRTAAQCMAGDQHEH